MRSPMSIGVWGLLAFSFFSGITAVIQAAKDGFLGTWWGARWLARWPQKLIALPGTISGVFLGSYTGVLLAATSIPVWSRSKMLGAVFISSALSTSGALISCVLRIVGAPKTTLHKLERIEWFSMLVEMTNLLLFLRGSGRAARSLVGTEPTEQGPIFWRFMFGSGLVLPWLLQTLSLLGQSWFFGRSVGAVPGVHPRGPFTLTSKGKHRIHPRGQAQGKGASPLPTPTGIQSRGSAGIIVSLLVLIGGYFLRRTIIHAGHVSSRDARTTLFVASSNGSRK
jgi:formate-dependent nitrite reductase membrane component NrfD